MSELLDAALNYAQLGIRVFPLKVDAKIPLTAHGHHDATTDEVYRLGHGGHTNQTRILDWSLAREAGIVVIDVEYSELVTGSTDAPRCQSCESEHGSFSTAVRTPSGGAHFYFEYPAEFIGQVLKKRDRPRR